MSSLAAMSSATKVANEPPTKVANEPPTKMRRVHQLSVDEALPIKQKHGLREDSTVVLIGTMHYTVETSKSCGSKYYCSIHDADLAFWSAQDAYNDELIKQHNLKQAVESVQEEAPQELVAAAEEEPKQESKQEDAEIAMEELDKQQEKLVKQQAELDKQQKELDKLFDQELEALQQQAAGLAPSFEGKGKEKGKDKGSASKGKGKEKGKDKGFASKGKEKGKDKGFASKGKDEFRSSLHAAYVAQPLHIRQDASRSTAVPCRCGRPGALASKYCCREPKVCGDCCRAEGTTCEPHQKRVAENSALPRAARAPRDGHW
jgi:hypothetical protein